MVLGTKLLTPRIFSTGDLLDCWFTAVLLGALLGTAMRHTDVLMGSGFRVPIELHLFKCQLKRDVSMAAATKEGR